MPWIRNARRDRWLASVSSLASTTLPSRAAAAFSSAGVSWRHGPHHSAQKSTTTGTWRERSTTSALEVLLGDVDDHASRVGRGRVRRSRRPASTLAGEDAGEGIPVVLLHGLTATRRYVVMGSKRAGALRAPRRRLRRARARPLGAGARRDATATTTWPTTCVAVLDDRGHRARGAGRRLDGRAHRRAAARSSSPSASPGSSIVTPAFRPGRTRDGLARWDALAEGLRERRGRGLRRRLRRPGVPERVADTVVAVLRQRLVRARAPGCGRRRARARCRARARSRRGTTSPRSTCRRSSSAAATRPTPATRCASAERYAAAMPGAELRRRGAGAVAAGLAGRPALEGHRRACLRGRPDGTLG